MSSNRLERLIPVNNPITPPNKVKVNRYITYAVVYLNCRNILKVCLEVLHMKGIFQIRTYIARYSWMFQVIIKGSNNYFVL